MKVFTFKYLVIALLAANVSLLAQAQTQPSPDSRAQVDSEKGITGFETFHGTTTTTTASHTNSGIGNAYLGFTLMAPSPKLDYASSVTAYAPTGSAAKGLSTGRVGVDWTNRFEHTFHGLTPFFDAGLSNTVPDSVFFARPFTSLGAISHLEEGAEYQLVEHFYAGGSGYQIVPLGSQKVFSKLSGKGKGKNSFDTSTVSTGNNLTRENGFSTWVALVPSSIARLELGYTRSMTFDLNSFAFNLRMNVGKVLHPKHNYKGEKQNEN